MPLIIHPSSCCDVCLDALTYNGKPPFAIPCGHIFCRSCLFGMNPSLCPLCRKPFLPERSKKLITGEVEVPEVEGIEDKKAIELLTKLVNSLNTEGHSSTILEVDLWLSAGNTHTLLQKVHEVLKEFFLLKSERSANLRSIRRLQRDMHRLQVDQSTEKEKALAMEQELLSQIEELQEKVRELEQRCRAATMITSNHNPLPTPPEPFPLDSLSFFANLQQNPSLSDDTLSQRSTDRTTQNTLHLNGVSTNTRESLAAAAPRPPSPGQTTIPSNPRSFMNERTRSHRTAIIPGASPNQRFILGNVFDEASSSIRTNMDGQTAPPVDPFVLATDYFTKYAAGFEEGYHMNQRYLQSSNRRIRQTRRTTEPAASSVVEPISQSSASSSRTLDDPILQQLSHISITNHSAHRPLGLQDFHTTSTTTGSSSDRRDDPASASRVSSPRPPILSSSSSAPIHDEPSEWPALPTLSSSSAPRVTTTPVDRTPSSYSLSSPTSAPASSNSTQSLSRPPTSAPPSSVTSTIFSDTRSSRSYRTSGSSRAREQRRRSDATSIEILWNTPTREAPVLIDSDSPRRRSAFSAHTSVQPSPLSGVVDSPASAHTIDSWGTVNTDAVHRVPHQPFRPAHQINSVSDLGLRLFDDITDVGTMSQRSSFLSDITHTSSSSHNGLEGSGNVESHGSDSQNWTPRVAPQPLPETESVSSPETILPPFIPSRDPGRHWNSSHHDLDHNRSQHHGIFSGASETWHRATADLTSIQPSSHAHSHSHSHSHSIAGPVPDHSSRASHHHTTRPATAATDDNTTSSRWETTPLASTNALGLRDLALSPEPRISAPTPIMPSRSFLRFYNDNYH